MKKSIRVWDLPTRIFHWLFALTIIGSIITIQLGEQQLHAYCGYTALILIFFRIIWGFIGPFHIRFVNFIPTWSKLRAYFQGIPFGGLGHNPLGALSVIALIFIPLIQGLTGLFIDDDIAFTGPLSKFISNDLVSTLSSMHRINSNLIYGVITLHVVAILYYLIFKRKNLIKPMIDGDQLLSEEHAEKKSLEPLPQSSLDDWQVRVLALFIVLSLCFIFWYFVLS
jgi:cytochrome b